MDSAKSSGEVKTGEHAERLKKAINLLIRDQEGEYDECLVERFFDYLADGEQHLGAIALKVLLDIYADTEFASMNQSRLFRFQRAYYDYYLPMDISITRSSEFFWSRLPLVILKNDPSEIKAALALLISVVNGRSSFNWIIRKQFQEPIQSGRIKDIVSLARYFLTTSRNYHIQNAACTLMADLIKQSIKRHISTSNQFLLTLKQNIEELLQLDCPGIYYVLNECLNNGRTVPNVAGQLTLIELLQRSLDAAIKREKHADVNSICKCLALAKVEENLVVTKLQNAGYLGPLITYATHLYRDIFNHTRIFYIILYPLLANCEGDEAEELMGRLIMTRAEKQFVKRYLKDSHVVQCLQYMTRSLSIRDRNIYDLDRQPKRTFILILDVLLEYIRFNYDKSEKNFKNLMMSCIILRNVQERFIRKSETMWLYKLMDTLMELLGSLDNEVSSKRRALVLEIIRLMGVSMRKLKFFRSSNFVNKTDKYRIKIIQIAFRITHLDILDEIAYLFSKYDFDFFADPETNKLYVDVIWNHMYKLARDEHDRNLLASVTNLFPVIDVKANDEVLDYIGVVRYHTIPKLLSDILIDLSTDDKSIELISKSINYSYPNSSFGKAHSIDFVKFKTHPSYMYFVCTLSSDSLVEHMTKAICVAIKRDLHHTFQTFLLRSLCTIIDEYARPKVDSLEFLIRTRALETLYYIHESPSYIKQVRKTVCETIRSLRLFITKPVNTIINLIKEDDPSDVWRQERASDMVKFYCSIRHGKCESVDKDTSLFRENKLDMDAYVNQILNQERTISFDCY